MFKPHGRQHSTFESKTLRDSYIAKTSVAPAPGHYTYDSSSFKKAQRHGKGLAVFRSTKPKLSGLYPAVSRHVPGPGTYLTGAHCRVVWSMSQAWLLTSHCCPPADKTVPKRIAVKDPAKKSSVFSNLNCDRWGVPFERKTMDDNVPGPGAYSKPVVHTTTRVSASSHVFLSNVHRLGNRSKGVKPPGPAFYKPSQVPKKSFLLNAARRWV